MFRIDEEQQQQQQLEHGESTGRVFKSISAFFNLFVIWGAGLAAAVRVCSSSHDFTARLTAAALFIVQCQCSAMFISMGLNMQKITKLHETLQATVNGEGDCVLFALPFKNV